MKKKFTTDRADTNQCSLKSYQKHRYELYTKRRPIRAVFAAALTAALLAGCGAAGQSALNAQEGYTIGISQFAEHGSLENCREGFLQGLAEAGIEEGKNLTVLFDNAQADTGVASTIAENFVARKVDMICAIATPSAMSAYNSAEGTGIPVVYTAISDPAAAGIAGEDGMSGGNITGTSDALPVKEQLEMIRTMLPDAVKIGILYTTSEANSVSTIEEYRKYAPDYGFEIVDKGVSTPPDVPVAAAGLASQVDCISNLTDNTVVTALQAVLDVAEKNRIPVFGSEVEQVKNGCVAAMGIDYVELGRKTGAMAAKILKKETTASGMPYETVTGANLYINREAAEKIEMPLDEEYLSEAKEIFEEITVTE